jgi:hypothetical protein
MARPHHIQFARLLLAGLTMLVSVAPWGNAAHGAVPASCTGRIQNGGFEDGGEGWQETSHLQGVRARHDHLLQRGHGHVLVLRRLAPHMSHPGF